MLSTVPELTRLRDVGICHLLESTHPSLQIVSRVFPMYQTRGELVGFRLSGPDKYVRLLRAWDVARRNARFCRLVDDHGRGTGERSWCRWRSGKGKGRLARAFVSHAPFSSVTSVSSPTAGYHADSSRMQDGRPADRRRCSRCRFQHSTRSTTVATYHWDHSF